jgi:hypothetical protein
LACTRNQIRIHWLQIAYVVFHGVSLAGVCIYRVCPPVYTCQAHFDSFPNVRFERVA